MSKSPKLAIDGGPKTKTTPFGTGKRFGRDELRELREALDQNTLFYVKGTKVKQLCEQFAAMYGVKHAVATTSGTAAIHVALAAVGVTVGDEVITSVLTDAGSFIGTLYQNAVPVFADIDVETYNMTAATIAERITPRTKAILVVHLAGSPADMDPIMKLARKHKLVVIEDCAQTYHGDYKGRRAGTIGRIGCFSLNDFKHISAGDAGLVVTDSPTLAKRLALFADKCYPRGKDASRDEVCSFLAPNYRMSELAGAVGLAQIRKLDFICNTRRDHGELLTELITDVPGVHPPKILPGCRSSYWFYLLRVDPDVLGISRDRFGEALTAEGIPASFFYRRVDQFRMFTEHAIYPPRPDGFVCPYDCPAYGAGRRPYRREDCPNAERLLETGLILQMNEFYYKRDIRDMARAIRKVATHYAAAAAAVTVHRKTASGTC